MVKVGQHYFIVLYYTLQSYAQKLSLFSSKVAKIGKGFDIGRSGAEPAAGSVAGSAPLRSAPARLPYQEIIPSSRLITRPHLTLPNWAGTFPSRIKKKTISVRLGQALLLPRFARQ